MRTRLTISQLRPEHYDDLRELFALAEFGSKPEQYNPDLTLVALVRDKAVGFIAAWDCGQPYVFIDNFFVHPEYRTKGVGYTLGYAMLAVLKQRGVTWYVAPVTTVNFHSIATRSGMTTIGGALMMQGRIG